MLSVLQDVASGCPFGIFKLFLCQILNSRHGKFRDFLLFMLSNIFIIFLLNSYFSVVVLYSGCDFLLCPVYLYSVLK